MTKIAIRIAESHDDFDSAGELFREYAAQIGGTICFQDFRRELDQLGDMYASPAGRLLLGMRGTTPVGCVGVRRVDASTCEMKRLYVRPSARGVGLGRRLAMAALESARALGYRSMVLDTLPSMNEAQTLYRSLGFRDAAAASGDPHDEAIYMECDLHEDHLAQ